MASAAREADPSLTPEGAADLAARAWQVLRELGAADEAALAARLSSDAVAAAAVAFVRAYDVELTPPA